MLERMKTRMNTTTIALSIVGILIIMMTLCIFIIRYSFKNVFHAPRKTKKEAFELLEKRGVYDPSHYKDLEFEELKVVSEDGYMLRGQYLNFFPEGEKALIFIHGYTASHLMGLQFVELYKEMGYNVLLIDARSHGESGAMYPTYGVKEVHDVNRWKKALQETYKNITQIGLHGQSMGAATALMYGGKYNDVAFIIADCPYSSAKDILHYQFKKFGHVPPKPVYKMVRRLAEKKIGIELDEACPQELIQESQVPVLFIHGNSDQTVPSSMSEKMYNSRGNSADKLVLIDGANHVEAYMVDQITYKESVRSFIANA